MKVWIPLIALAFLILYRHRIAEELQYFRAKPRPWLYEKWKNWGEPFLIAAVLAILIRTYLVGPYKIPTGSMRPTFMEGDRIFVNKISYHFNEPERGDIIVFKYPLDRKKDFVKRLVGLPGETIEIRNGMLYVNGEALDDAPFSNQYYYNRDNWLYGQEGQAFVVPANHYFVLGDNSAHSSDGRHWGFVPDDNVVGKAFIIWWPLNRIKSVG